MSVEREILNITKLEGGDLMYKYVQTNTANTYSNIYSLIYYPYYAYYPYYLDYLEQYIEQHTEQENIYNIIALLKIINQNVMLENTTTRKNITTAIQPLS